MSRGPVRFRDDPVADDALKEWLGELRVAESLSPEDCEEVSLRLHASIAAAGVAAAGTGLGLSSPGAVEAGAQAAGTGISSTGAAAGTGISSTGAAAVGVSGKAGGIAGSSLMALISGKGLIVGAILSGAVGVGGVLALGGETPSDVTRNSPGAEISGPATSSELVEARETSPVGAADDGAAKSLEEADQHEQQRQEGWRANSKASSTGLRRTSPSVNSVGKANLLSEEVRLLRAARQALPEDPAAARKWLREYSRRFPHGTLRQEYATLWTRANSEAQVEVEGAR